MPTPATFAVESYFDEFADKSAMEEAARVRTIPTGTYLVQAVKHEGAYYEQTPEGYWKRVFTEGDADVNPEWRKGVRFNGKVYKAEEPDKSLGYLNIEASWEAKRDAKTGEYDKLFKRWEQLSRALFPGDKDYASKPIGEVVGAIKMFPVKVRVTEAFQSVAIDGSKSWVYADTPEQAKGYREAGYKATNFIMAISKAS